MDWNFSERRRGVDQWPEATATVTNIDQPFNDPKHDFLSVIAFSFKSAKGEYASGSFPMRTCNLPDDLMTGSSITIRYNPEFPDKNWCEFDYYRQGFGRWQAFGFPILFWSIVLLGLLSTGAIMLFKLHK